MTFWQQLNLTLGFYSNISDEALMGRVKEGDDRTAFRALFERHYRQVYARLIKMGCPASLAEDIVQDVFLAVYRSRETYRNHASFRPWVTAMARNRLIDYWRSHNRQLIDDHAELDELDLNKQTVEEELIKKEELELLENGLSKLKQQDRELITLWIDDFSYEEIAEIVGKSVAAVKFALHQAKKKLAKQNLGQE